MSSFRADGRFIRVLGLMVWLGMLTPGLALGKVDPPIVSSFQLLTSPTLGGQCQVIWAGVPEVAPLTAELAFALTTPDGKVVTSHQPVALARGKVTDVNYSFTVTSAGTYAIASTLLMTTAGGSFTKVDSLNIVVPAQGKVYLAPEPVLNAKQYAARFGPSQPALLASPSPLRDASSGFTVSGRFRYTNRLFDNTGFTGTRLDPIRRASVEFVETDPGVSTTTLGTILTADDGSFSFNVPPGGAGANGRTLRIRLMAIQDAVRVQDLRGQFYFLDIPVVNWLGGALNLGTTDMNLDQSGPWNIFDCIVTGSDFVRGLTNNAAVPRVTCNWAVGNSEGTYYSNVGRYIMFLGTYSDPDEFDDAVILHEYGHFIATNYSYDKSPGGPHAWTSYVSPQLAWSEGWASFFSSAIRNYPYYVDTNTIYGAMVIDLEEPTSLVTGDANEGAVAATLWDVFDSNNDGRDTLTDGMANIWHVFGQYFTFNRACVLRDFYDGWIASSRGHYTELQNILAEHGMNYPTLIVKSMGLNNGVAGAVSRTVTINNTCIGKPIVYMASEDPKFTGAVWKTYSTAPTFTFAEGNGNKGVYFKVKDADGQESAVVSDSILIGSVPATMLTIDGPSVQGDINSEFDYEFYRFTVTTAGIYTVDTSVGTLTDSVMGLYGPNDFNNLIVENDDGHGSADYMSRITRELQPGTYQVRVRGFATEVGTYRVWVVAGGPAVEVPEVILNGPAVAGSILFSEGITENWFRFIVTTPGAYTIQTDEGSLFDTIVTLYGPGSRTALIEWDDDGGKGFMSLISRTLIPGTYYVKVESYTKNISGNYTLRVYTGKREEVIPLALNSATLSDTIETSRDFHWYSFTAPLPGKYTIESIAGTLKDSYLYLYGPNSPEVYLSENDTINADAMAGLSLNMQPGTYYFKVEGRNPTDLGTYGVRVRFPVQGTELNPNGSWTESATSSLYPYIWFNFTVPTAGDYLIDTSPGTLTDTVLYLYGPDDPLRLRAQNDDVDGKSGRSSLTLPLQPGTYAVRVEGYASATSGPGVGSFYVRAYRFPLQAAPPLTIDAPATTGAISYLGAAAWHSFTVTTRNDYAIETFAGTLHSDYIRVFGPNSQVQLLGQAGGAGSMGSVLLNLAPGTYYVKVQGFSATDLGTYSIRVRQALTPLSLNGPPITRAIASASDAQWYSFQVPVVCNYTIETWAGTLSDNYLRLYGPDSRVALLGWNNDSGVGRMAKLSMTLTPGTYYIKIQGYQATDLGTYSIGVRQNVIPLAIGGAPFTNMIAPVTDSDLYSFSVTRKGSYVIETTAGTLSDNYLRLYRYMPADGQTRLIGQNDNGGSGKMAKLILTLDPGLYLMRINARYTEGVGTYGIGITSAGP